MRSPTTQELQAWFLYMRIQGLGADPYPGIIYSWLSEFAGQPPEYWHKTLYDWSSDFRAQFLPPG